MDLYFLRSQRLGFRRWSDDDLELALGLWGDPRVTRLIGGPFTEQQVRRRLADEIAVMTAEGIQYWPVFLLATDEHVGCCGLRPHGDGVRELGFHLRAAHWGRGYASEAARTVIRHAFVELRANALFAGHHPENRDSRRTLERLGFRYSHDALYPPTGLLHPSYLLTAEEHANLRARNDGG